MIGELFLWGGFLLGCLWHLASWAQDLMYGGGQDFSARHLSLLNLGISGGTLCAFGYLLFP